LLKCFKENVCAYITLSGNPKDDAYVECDDCEFEPIPLIKNQTTTITTKLGYYYHQVPAIVDGDDVELAIKLDFTKARFLDALKLVTSNEFSDIKNDIDTNSASFKILDDVSVSDLDITEDY
jgi:hypothetical protein